MISRAPSHPHNHFWAIHAYLGMKGGLLLRNHTRKYCYGSRLDTFQSTGRRRYGPATSHYAAVDFNRWPCQLLAYLNSASWNQSSQRKQIASPFFHGPYGSGLLSLLRTNDDASAAKIYRITRTTMSFV